MKQYRYAVIWKRYSLYETFDEIACFKSLDEAARYAADKDKARVYGLNPEYEVHVTATVKP